MDNSVYLLYLLEVHYIDVWVVTVNSANNFYINRKKNQYVLMMIMEGMHKSEWKRKIICRKLCGRVKNPCNLALINYVCTLYNYYFS